MITDMVCVSDKDKLNRSTARRESAFIKKADALAAKGLYDEAVQLIEQVIALSPSKAAYYVRLADIYCAQRKLDKAVKSVKRAIDLEPEDLSLHETILQLYMELSRFEEAIREAKSILKTHPRNLFVREVLTGALLHCGRLDAALRAVNELIALDPTDPSHYFKRAVILQQKGDLSRAMQEFSRVLLMDPDFDLAEAAREAIGALDGFQLRQIATLASEDATFYAKLIRDPELAVAERGFVLSVAGLLTLKQIDFQNIPDSDLNLQRYYH